MVRSMTGYGRVQILSCGYQVTLEIKTVNHRFFEFTARLPRVYGYLEDKLRTYAQQYILRGKAEVMLSIERPSGADTEVLLNEHLVKNYIDALQKLQTQFNLKNDVTVSTIARLPDIFSLEKAPENEQEIWGVVEQAAEQAFANLVRMREAEGENLQKDLMVRAEKIRSLVETVESRSPQTVEEYRSRLTAHMEEVLSNAQLDENRILLEAAVYADKVSVTEETVRLKSHLVQFAKILDNGGAVGRKLDFLMQEMNREANTIGSKASDTEIARVVVDIKAELEKMREQIQNIE